MVDPQGGSKCKGPMVKAVMTSVEIWLELLKYLCAVLANAHVLNELDCISAFRGSLLDHAFSAHCLVESA